MMQPTDLRHGRSNLEGMFYGDAHWSLLNQGMSQIWLVCSVKKRHRTMPELNPTAKFLRTAALFRGRLCIRVLEMFPMCTELLGQHWLATDDYLEARTLQQCTGHDKESKKLDMRAFRPWLPTITDAFCESGGCWAQNSGVALLQTMSNWQSKNKRTPIATVSPTLGISKSLKLENTAISQRHHNGRYSFTLCDRENTGLTRHLRTLLTHQKFLLFDSTSKWNHYHPPPRSNRLTTRVMP